jgi:hypothetical protein
MEAYRGFKRKPAEFVQCGLKACTGAAFDWKHLFFVTVPEHQILIYLRLKSCTKNYVGITFHTEILLN